MFGSLDSKFTGMFESLDSKFTAKFESVDTKLDIILDRIGHGSADGN
jgi:hypothetical protein